MAEMVDDTKFFDRVLGQEVTFPPYVKLYPESSRWDTDADGAPQLTIYAGDEHCLVLSADDLAMIAREHRAKQEAS